MAETDTQDVVKQAQSVDDSSSIDVSGNHSSSIPGAGDEGVGTGGETQHTADTTQNTVNGHPSTFDPESMTSDYSHINGADSASYTGSEDNTYQRSIDGELQSIEPRGIPEGSWRDRSNSISKKQTSFKSVSVTKNYLAKSGTAPPVTIKPGLDKGPSSMQQSMASLSAAKPRLVAKSGRDKLSHTTSGAPSNTGPDASKVWNRNRPAPVAPPKSFTDEELKQQYGIHMATRLQADEANKDGKWADIEDDEDDWAPDTVQWMDGTKSSLLAEKASAPQVKPPQAQTQPKPASESEQKATPPEIHPPSGLASAGKTILRPGARNNVQTKPGLALKSVPEAPSPPVRQPSTSNGKSPWAPLPVVDKASPITFNPPQPPPLQYNDARRNSSAIEDVPDPLPPKEIAADDFNRSWHDNDRGSQTLFNSQSGRYEPVRGGARRSSRNDNGFRQPSVLQRPSQGQMEPFHDGESQGRMGGRTSSDHQDGAKPSFHTPAPTSSATENSAASPEDGKQPFAAQGGSDPRTEQHRLMRERIELNRKRKQEEVAKEEAAKQERIRQRLAALAPPKEEAGNDNEPETTITTMGETSMADPQPPSVDQPQHESPSENSSSLPLQPSQPSSDLSPAQPFTQQQTSSDNRSAPASANQSQIFSRLSPNSRFGQNPTPDSQPSVFSTAQSPELTELPGLGQLPSDSQSITPFNRNQASPWSTNTVNMPVEMAPARPRYHTVNDPPPAEYRCQHIEDPVRRAQVIAEIKAQEAQQNNKARMSSNGMAQRSRPYPVSATQAQTGPKAGPPFHTAAVSPHPTPSPPMAQAHQVPQGPRAVPVQQQPMSNATLAQSQPTAMPTAYIPGSRPSPDAPGAQRYTPDAWAAFSNNPRAWDAKQDKAKADANVAAFNARMDAKRAALGNSLAPVNKEWEPVVSFKKTTDLGDGSRSLEQPKPVQEESAHISSSKAPLATVPNGRTSKFFNKDGQPLPPNGGAKPPETTFDENFMASKNTSPPPDGSSHPAFEAKPSNTGVSPVTVKMPSAKPQVKLPPAQSATPVRTNASRESATSSREIATSSRENVNVIMPPRHQSGSQAIVNSPSWQDRINGLFNRGDVAKSQMAVNDAPTVKSAPASATQPSAPITSSSKAALVGSPTATAATVSLPQHLQHIVFGQHPSVPPGLDETDAATKIGIEATMDEREGGSKPVVNFRKGPQPRDATVLQPMPSGTNISMTRNQEVSVKAFSRTVADELSFHFLDSEDFHGATFDIRIRLPGKDEIKKTHVRRARGQGPNTQNSGKPGRNQASKKRNASGKSEATNKANTSKPRAAAAAAAAAKRESLDASNATKPPPTSNTATSPSQQPAPKKSNAWPKPPKGNNRRNNRPVSAQRQTV